MSNTAARGLEVLNALPESLRTNSLVRDVLLSPSDEVFALAQILKDNGGASVMAPSKLDAVATLGLATSWDLIANTNSPRVLRGALVAALPLLLHGFAELSPAKKDAFVTAVVPSEPSCQQLRDTAE